MSSQVVSPHGEPWTRTWHVPEPLHSPSWPQGFCRSGAQSSPGSVFALTGPHTPLAPDSLSAVWQAMQGSLHWALQHTLSTQKPDWHCAAEAQSAPFARSFTHVEPLHQASSIHAVSELQLEAHCVPAQRKSPQSCGVVTHLPKPSQALEVAKLWAAPVPSVQPAGPQSDPFAKS
jgi:hypothetical protein